MRHTVTSQTVHGFQLNPKLNRNCPGFYAGAVSFLVYYMYGN
jgi:hypothetical protein